MFIQKLFELRRVFHRIGARDSRNCQHTPVIICWVDVFLSRLGDAIPVIVAIRSGLESTDATSLVFEDHRRKSSLRAALQLPGESALAHYKRDDHTGYREMGISSRHALVRSFVPSGHSIGYPVDVRCICYGHNTQRGRGSMERWVCWFPLAHDISRI